MTSGAPIIDLYNDGGVSNDVTLYVGYPDAGNIMVTPPVWQAGQTTNITITGDNMGTFPQVYVTPFDITYSQGTVTGNTISATVTVPSTETATQALVYVTPANSCGYANCYQNIPSSDPGNPNGAAPPASVPIIPFTPPPPTIILGSGASGSCSSASPVTTTQNVVVGQPITFSGCFPSSQTAGTSQWSPGSNFTQQNAIAGFSVSSSNVETLTNISATSCSSGAQYCDFNQFYFVTPGTYTFTFSYNAVNSPSYTPTNSITFSVTGPTADATQHFITASQVLSPAITSTTTAPYTTQMYWASTYGGVIIPGISFAPTGNAVSGSWLWVQLLTSVQTTRTTTPATPSGSYSGLDGTFPYATFSPTTGSPIDSPRMVIDYDPEPNGITSRTAASETFNATMYLMWDPAIPPGGSTSCTPANYTGGTLTPSTCASIPVPISSLNWGFQETATKSSSAPWNSWSSSGSQSPTLATQPSDSVNESTSGYPTWTAVATNIN